MKSFVTEAPRKTLERKYAQHDTESPLNFKMVIVTIFGFGSRLCESKVLTSLTSVVFNENLLISLGFKKVFNFFACFYLILKYFQREQK
jgi:hypothetical protein